MPLPDYGLYLLKQQHDQQEPVRFPCNSIDHLTAISQRKFTTVVSDCLIRGQRYSAFFGFQPEILARMLHLMSNATEKLVLNTLAEAREFPKTIMFPEPVHCSIEARLRVLRFAADQMFVPFKIVSIDG